MRHPSLLFCLLMLSHPVYAQNIRPNPLLEEEQKASGFDSDSTETTNVPEGIYVWKIDPRFGDIHPATYDTIPHRFQNENFTSGPTGRYNYTGNLGAPRISRLFNEQTVNMQYNPFIFKQPYDFFLKGAGDLLYTNTKSPFTNITYHSCGNKTNGEDRIRALFSVNSGKNWVWASRPTTCMAVATMKDNQLPTSMVHSMLPTEAMSTRCTPSFNTLT